MEEFNNENKEQNETGSVYSYSYDQINQAEVKVTQEPKTPEQNFYTEPKAVLVKEKTSFGKKCLHAVAYAVIFGLVAGVVFQGVNYGARFVVPVAEIKTDTNSVLPTQMSDPGIEQGSSTSKINYVYTDAGDLSKMVEQVMPSIVQVTNVSITEYRTWFGQTFTQETPSSGSGIIVSQDTGFIYVATNNHVVQNANTLTITFDNGDAVEGTVKGADSMLDVAVVAVPVASLQDDTLGAVKVASIGNSDKLKVGQNSAVIGNALGYGKTVTSGVISALNREVTLTDEETGTTFTNELIQTDAAINPGNSGGALLDMSGKVIGIVSSKYSATSIEGTGFAIPISVAYPLLDQMINSPVVDESNAGYLGISGNDVNASLSTTYGLPTGVYITKVNEDGAAYEAGLVKGDIITKINGRNVSSMSALKSILKYIPAGQEVEVTVARAGKGYETEDITITLKSREESHF